MESSSYAERTIAFYERLKANHPNTGLCLQSYLRRTAADIQRLLPLDPAIRLVKGAYAEPAPSRTRAATTSTRTTSPSRSRCSRRSGPGRAVRIGLGTHDVRLIEQIAEHAAALGLTRPRSRSRCSTASGRREQRRLASEGYRVRDLIAYGEAWYPWYMRRLAERPANVLFALRQLLP